MTRSELVEKIAAKVPNLTIRDIDHIVDVIFNKLATALAAGDRIELRGFGSFSVRRRPPRIAVNPRNKTKINIPAKNVVHFRTGRDLHSRLNSQSI